MPLYNLLRPALFRLAPERAHHFTCALLHAALGTAAARRVARARSEVRDPRLALRCFGINLPNPVGLAAGFDKDGTLFNALGALGFGFIEIGTITARAQPGNPPPRLFRLPADEALLNRMGFNNPGADAVAAALSGTRIEPILGINLGKSKATPLEDAAADYLRSARLLAPFARYLVVNVSSPNTPGLRALQDAAPLRALLRALRAESAAVPLLLKIAPDLTQAQIEEAASIAAAEGAAGIIATNTTLARDGLRSDTRALGVGGISGAPLRHRAREVVARVWQTTRGALPIIGVGGIFGADDAWAMIRAGASLVQLYTGFVYRGPALPREINRGLLRQLEREGMRSLADAVGADHR